MIGSMRRTAWRQPRHDARPAGRAVIAYAAAWLVAVGAVVGVVFAVFGGDDADTVSVPPVRETQLADAAGQNRCQLRSATVGERLNPPVDGPAGVAPAKAGFYDEPVASAALTAALRHGIVVIQYRAGLSDQRLDALKTLQEAAPTGTIVAPNGTGMHFELAVTAYRRLLGCPRFTDRALDAVQLFRGRFVGSGPESS
jgi:hypothetical protein